MAQRITITSLCELEFRVEGLGFEAEQRTLGTIKRGIARRVCSKHVDLLELLKITTRQVRLLWVSDTWSSFPSVGIVIQIHPSPASRWGFSKVCAPFWGFP